MESFMTTLAWIWVVVWLAGFGLLIAEYYSMPKWQQAFTSFNISFNKFFLFLASVAWLISR